MLADPSQEELDKFYNLLESRNPTPNMMRWMQYYTQICPKSCCHSIDCASIRCSSCNKSLTKQPPSLRYQCMECPLVPPEAPYNPKPDLCYECFLSPNVLHNHVKWLKITEKGVHSIEIRQNGICALKVLDGNIDFPFSENKELDCCFICSDDFDINNPRVKFPGCRKDHGNAIKDKNEGIIDNKEHAHRDCLLQWYKISFREKYCGKPKYCEVCNFEEEMNSWKEDFIKVRSKIQKDGNLDLKEIADSLNIEIDQQEKNNDISSILQIIRKKLLELHPQPWIQKIIVEIFI